MSRFASSNEPYQAPLQPVFMPYLAGPLELVTAPVSLPVDLPTARKWCRQDEGIDDDTITSLIRDAVDYVEQDGGRTLLTTTFDLPVLTWWTDELRLPRPPLQSATWVKYYDSAGDQQTLDASEYEVRTPWKQPGGIVRTPNQSWPALECYRKYPITIRFVAGFTNAATVPGLIRRAIQLLVSHWYDNRGAIGEPLAAADRLLALAGWGSYK